MTRKRSTRPKSRLLRANGERPRHDWYAFTVAFKGVFLEGLEVAFIVVTFGGTQRNVGLAAAGAAAALVVVLIAGAIVHAPLTRVPENTLKFGVGVMLTSFGIFWSCRRRRRRLARRRCVAPRADRVRRARLRSCSSRSCAERAPRGTGGGDVMKWLAAVRKVLVRLHHR